MSGNPASEFCLSGNGGALVGKPFRTVLHINDATIGETVLQENVLENFIVTVSVYTQVRTVGRTPFQA